MQHLSFADSAAYARIMRAFKEKHITVNPRLVEIIIKKNDRAIWEGLGFGSVYDEWQVAIKSLPHKRPELED